MMGGGDGRCHIGRLEWDRLATPRTNDSVDFDAPLAKGKHTTAGGLEVLAAAIISGMSFRDPMRFQYCSAFKHKINESCPNSPCPKVLSMPYYYYPPQQAIQHSWSSVANRWVMRHRP